MNREPFTGYLHYLLLQVQARAQRELQPELTALGLTAPQWRVLFALQRFGRSNMSELSEFIQVERSTLTRTVDQLEQEGLASRRAEPTDRRAVAVELEDKGREALAHAVKSLGAHSEHLLQGLTPDERGMLVGLLQRMLANIVQDEDLLKLLVDAGR